MTQDRQAAGKAAWYLALVFAAGAAAGFAANDFYRAQTAEARETQPNTASGYHARLVQELDSRLNLDDDQVSEILLVLDEVGDRFFEVRDAMEPEFEAIRRERAERVMALLSPAQRLEYEKVLEERRIEREKDRLRYRGK